MIFAVVDVETSAIGGHPNPDKDECCEFAIIVADHESKTIIAQYSNIYKVKQWDETSADIHKIPESLSQSRPTAHAMSKLSELIDIDEIEYVIAHNAIYDKSVIKRYWPEFAEKNWLCSMNDFLHEGVRITSKRLSHIASDYEILIPKWHRAHSDCSALLEISFQNDIQKAWENKNKRQFQIVAKGKYHRSIPPKFKERKWRWDPENKQWYKNVSAEEVVDEVKFAESIKFNVTAEEIFKDY